MPDKAFGLLRHKAALEELGISPALIEARGLLPCSEADQLEVAEVGANGKEHLLVREAALAWRQMKTVAEAEGITLFIVSAFRSVERQVEIVRRKLKAGKDIEDILCVSAPPGFSEHHTGCAIDIGTVDAPDLEDAFAETPAFAWLRKHAPRFGFKLSYPRDNPQGYRYEPWHWCFVAGQQAVPAALGLRKTVLRQAAAADIPGMHRVRMAVKENRLVTTQITEADYAPAIEKTGRGWVVEIDGQVVAFAVGNKTNGNIWALFVDPAHEHKGHGRLLHDEMIKWLKDQGLSTLWLTTQPATRAERFYAKAGWTRVGITETGEMRFERTERLQPPT